MLYNYTNKEDFIYPAKIIKSTIIITKANKTNKDKINFNQNS